MKRTLNILLLLIATLSYSQNTSESDVFKIIIDYEIEKGAREMYFQCEKSKTFFESERFKEETELNVPKNILKEIKINVLKSENGLWDSKLINELNFGENFIKNKKCLTKIDAEKLFKKTNKRQNIISISEPIFDDNHEHCIVSVSHWMFTGSGYGNEYFLKKVYGIWIVMAEYGGWLT